MVDTNTALEHRSERDIRSLDMQYNSSVEDFREYEYPNMAQGAYLDHGGATIYARSLITGFSQAMIGNLWGNPHSDNLPAKLSGDMVDNIRAKALDFVGADPKYFDLVFVANATAAIKLVADAFRDIGEKTPTKGFWYGCHKEAHTSIIGVRALTSGDYHCFEDDESVEEWISRPFSCQSRRGKSTSLGLFAYPGQSNLSGRRLPQDWSKRIRQHPQLRNVYTLFDAAALAMTSSLSSLFHDPMDAPDFTCLSFYKIFGFPDLGALVVRRASGHILNMRSPFMYGDPSLQGPTFAFNIMKEDGSYIPWTEVERLANSAGVYIRAGGKGINWIRVNTADDYASGVCCPGGVAKALDYEDWEWDRIFSSGHACGSSEMAVIHNKPTGIVRASLGPMTTKRDIQAFISFLSNEFIAKSVPMPRLLGTAKDLPLREKFSYLTSEKEFSERDLVYEH
ncbi:molybdenum cofactor sulfurase [Fusarium pseudocircinatum]|uniref:Molybdenum cofactor sulfurase n=1 Tax=Fusarium pseudocircinatum TaxID=56676 RepID=A0A8H5NXM9_9HYPO|nr:molybdenum cofactor sulfurase [Fusarium pseudocircinatum]